MTDRESPEPGELSESEVSALLGSLGRDEAVEPLPDDVRVRLDETLAGLVRERQGDAAQAADAGGNGPAGVTPLPRGRRTGIGRRLLAAAAILGVVGVGAGVAGGVLGDLTGGQAEDATTAGDAAESEGAGTAGGARERPAEKSGGGRSESADQSAPEASDEAPQGLKAAGVAPEVGTDRALRQVVRVTATRATAAYDERDTPRDTAAKRDGAGCVAPDTGGTTVAVTYRGDDATLVVRRDGDVLEGRVYDCSLGLQLDGVRLPAPTE